MIVLALVTTTAGEVRKTSQTTRTNQEPLWPTPVVLRPEYLLSAVSGISMVISLRILLSQKYLTLVVAVMGILFTTKFSEKGGRLGLAVNATINILLFLAWIIAIIIFKSESGPASIWGFSCSPQSINNAFINYNSVCIREVPTFYIQFH